MCVCHRRSSVICPTAPPRPSLLRGSPRGSGSPSRSPSDHLVFFKLLVTTTFSTQRVIISPWSDCHHHPHHYPILSALNVFLMLFFWFFFFFFWEYSQTHLQGRFLTFSEVQKNVIYCTCVFSSNTIANNYYLFLNMELFFVFVYECQIRNLFIVFLYC